MSPVTAGLTVTFSWTSQTNAVNMAQDISVVKESCGELGEAPYWDETTRRLLWVDILGKSVHLLDPETGKVCFDQYVSSMT